MNKDFKLKNYYQDMSFLKDDLEFRKQINKILHKDKNYHADAIKEQNNKTFYSAMKKVRHLQKLHKKVPDIYYKAISCRTCPEAGDVYDGFIYANFHYNLLNKEITRDILDKLEADLLVVLENIIKELPPFSKRILNNDLTWAIWRAAGYSSPELDKYLIKINDIEEKIFNLLLK